MSETSEKKDYVAAPPPNEEVAAVTKPPRARVEDIAESADVRLPPAEEAASDKLNRKKDYLEGFLSKTPETASAGEPGGALYDAVIEALKDIYDPEIPVNIYDLGLIYGVDVAEEADVVVTMTLTTPHCPVAETMPGEIELRIGNLPGVRDAQVNVTWDPPWDPSKMSDEARLELGML
ncbi:SUF system Fe-S cluster assembly protein [Altericroceibacterium endophyticum]|uniref:SUF system Fe-S cluster assembly protein n=1 Tax=Altericroceibacterium endophyticum TaxID=1808508 RepID=A0A6I4T6Y1_9SPHN|nr:SUF system Fe-S cluster assembly protein [Altericroceibacterium endophyticum]MXO65595.1 SUF system Fe-S cluster assembly protein [Altericroceibacterium endophyticum]